MSKMDFNFDLQRFAGTTKIADVIVPEVFNRYVVERTAEKSALRASGIISQDANLNALASQGGIMINMPFWTDLDGDDQILSDSAPLDVSKIEAKKDIARLHARGNAWGVNDLAKALSGDDPMGTIASLVGEYWARREQKILLSTLKGVFASASMVDNIHDITAVTGADTFTGETFIDALHKLGDAENKLTALMIHSQTYASMRKQNLIEFIPNARGEVNIPTYMGKRVIVDDGCPTDGTNFTTYIFGEGAIGMGEGQAPVPTEVDRDSLSGEDYLINRRHFLLHPRGVKWTETDVVDQFPSNTELENGVNFERVYENKNVRLVKFEHKI